MLQLNPSLPVYVIDRGNGRAIMVIDYGPEDHLLWVIVMDETGEVWTVPNPQIRFRDNFSIGRNL